METTPVTQTQPQATPVADASTKPVSDPKVKVESADAKETKVIEKPSFDPKTYKHKVKVDGKESEVTLEELARDYQTKKLSDQKMMTATAKERRAEEFIKKLMSDPKSILRAKELGLTREQIRKLGEDLVAEELNEELMDPKDKEIRDLKAFKAEQEAEKEKRAKEEEDRKFLATKKRYADEYTKQIMEVVDKSTLPKTPYMVSRVARLMAASLDSEKPLTAMEAVPLVKEDYKSDINHFLKDLNAAQMIEFLGEDVGRKIREYDLAKLKTPLSELQKPQVQAEIEEPKSKKKEKRISATEWRKRFS